VGGARAIHRAPGQDAGPAQAPGRHRGVGLDGHALGKKGGDVTMESRGWAAASARYAIEVVGGSKSIDIVEGPG
jgi:hypothetical protein